MGYQRTLLPQIPVPDTDRQPELATAVELLSRSQRRIAEGQHTEAGGICRDVFEEVTRVLKDENGLGVPVAGLFEQARQMNKAERLRFLRRPVNVLTHPARHGDQVTAAIEWSRINASSIMTIMTGLLQELSAPGAV